MSNFRLKVFHSVATHLSFTKAAEELFISQPAVTKNIKELETELDIRLFNRSGTKISLTKAGNIVLEYAEEIIKLDKKLTFELNLLKNEHSGQLKLGASTTIGQYILPVILAKFNKKYPEIKLSLQNDNTRRIEESVIDKTIELGVVEGSSKNTSLKYIPFMKDEIVAIVHTSQPLAKKDEINLEELKHLPLVLRESGSGSLDVISNELHKHQIKLKELNILMYLGSTESIKSFLVNSNSIGLVSINAVTKEIANGEFKIIDVKDFEILRTFYFIHPHGKLSGLEELFIQFIRTITKSNNR